MLGSIFRLKSIEKNEDNQLWIVKMNLCSENEHELKPILVYMRQQLGIGETNLRRLGKVLWRMGKPDLAEMYFMRQLNELSSNDPSLSQLYTELGDLASQTRDYEKSVEWHQKAIALNKPNKLLVFDSIDELCSYIGKSITTICINSFKETSYDTNQILLRNVLW